MLEHEDSSEKLRAWFNAHFNGDVLILKLMGVFPMGDILKNDQCVSPMWAFIPVVLGLGGVMFSISCNIRNTIGLLHTDFMHAVEVSAGTMICLLTTAKGFRILLYREELHRLLRVCYLRWNIQVSRNTITGSVMNTARNTRLFTIGYAVAVVAANGAYMIRPYIFYLSFYLSKSNESFDFTETVFPAYYPFPLETIFHHFLWTTWENFVVYFINLWWIAGDCLFAQITTHLAIQFKILAEEIRHIDTVVTSMSPVRTIEIIKMMKRIVEEHIQLIKDFRAMEKWFSPIVALTVLFDGLGLCCNVFSLQYRIEQASWKDIMKNFTHATGIALQICLFCTFAQTLTDEMKGFRQAIYECPWTNFSIRVKSLMALWMTQTDEEYVCSAYNFFNLNMPQMTVIFSGAMKIFTAFRSIEGSREEQLSAEI